MEKKYTESGVEYKISIPGTNYFLQRQYPWADELQLEFNLIKEFTELIIGKNEIIDNSDIVISYYCGRDENGKPFGSQGVSIVGIDVSVPVKYKDKRKNLINLFSEVIKLKLSEITNKST